MQQKDRTNFVTGSSVEKLQTEMDSLITNIFLKQISSEKVQNRTISIAKTAILNDKYQGLLKTWFKKKALDFLPKGFQIIKKKLHTDDSNVAADLGRLFTLQLMIKNYSNQINSPNQNDQSARKTAQSVNDFVSNFDFGELYETISGSNDYVQQVVKTVSDMLLNQHTGKLAALSPSVIEIINMLVEMLNTLMVNNNDLPPDFVADFVSGLINLLNGKSIGTLLDQKNEMIRLLHTGDLLQGDSKASLFQTTMSKKAAEVFQNIDPEIYFKMITGKAGIKGAFKKGILLGLEEFPDLLKKIIESKAQVKNSQLSILTTRLSLLLKLPVEDCAECTSNYINSIDTDEISDLTGLFISLAAKMQESQPGLMGKFVSDIISSIDTDDLEEISGQMVKELTLAVSPVVSVLMPALINGICDLLLISINENTDELPSALLRLFGILKNGKEE